MEETKTCLATDFKSVYVFRPPLTWKHLGSEEVAVALSWLQLWLQCCFATIVALHWVLPALRRWLVVSSVFPVIPTGGILVNGWRLSRSEPVWWMTFKVRREQTLPFIGCGVFFEWVFFFWVLGFFCRGGGVSLGGTTARAEMKEC